MAESLEAAQMARADVVSDFARSELFDRTFKEGMAMVEETAAYLDGEGRQDSRLMSRQTALLYAGESMRLTTRLMQIASWLLVQRAVKEGDMSAREACDVRYRLSPSTAKPMLDPTQELPGALMELLDRSERLYDRILYLDRRMFVEPAEAPSAESNGVLSQMQRLQNAFGSEAQAPLSI